MEDNTMIGMNDTEYDEFVAGSAGETIKRLDSMHKIDIREFLDNFDLQFFGGKGDAPFFVTTDNRGVERVNRGLLAAYCRQNLAYVIIKELDGTAFKYVYDGGVYKLCSDETFMGYIKQYVMAYRDSLVRMSDISDAAKQISSDLNFTAMDAMNSDEDRINLLNGILNIRTLKLERHKMTFLSTIQLPVKWTEEDIQTPVFDRFMNDLTSGNEAVKDLILQYIGAILSNVRSRRFKKALFLYGKGNTGKSQLRNLVEMILGGKNCTSISLKQLETQFGAFGLYGKRLAGSADLKDREVADMGTFKEVTGGDVIHTDVKYHTGIDFRFNGFLWFCMNCLPSFGGDQGEWVYERIMPVECSNVIPKEKQDKYILDKMYEERDGIFRKAILAFREIYLGSCEFTEPEEVAGWRRKFRRENDNVRLFWDLCMEERTNYVSNDPLTIKKIHDAYRAFCHEQTIDPLTAGNFREAVANMLGSTKTEMVTRGDEGYKYKKYRLRPECEYLLKEPLAGNGDPYFSKTTKKN